MLIRALDAVFADYDQALKRSNIVRYPIQAKVQRTSEGKEK